MGLLRRMAGGAWPRPCIAELGGKNACVVTARGDLERAATGIVRSAFGLTGQKCSALSRLYVEEPAADALVAKLVERVRAIRVGDPCRRENWMGPVINAAAAEATRTAAFGSRSAAAASSRAGGGSTRASSRTATSWRRRSRRPPRITRSSARRCSSRS